MSQSADPVPTAAGGEEQPIVQLTMDQVVEVLEYGELDAHGLLPYSSNYNFLVTVALDSLSLPAVYKPRRGETPLWDFAQGTLCLRERAAYVMAEALGWELVPPTILRDGPHGLGSVQLYIDSSPEEHYFTFRENALFAEPLRQLALLDYVINNADRKSGHCLLSTQSRVWAIDHGICFHAEFKLRTVIWEFSQEPIAAALLADLDELADLLADGNSLLYRELAQLLDKQERRALRHRLALLLREERYPAPLPNRRNYPWPPI